MVSMMFYPLQRKIRGEGNLTHAECIDMLNEVQRMQNRINDLRTSIVSDDAKIRELNEKVENLHSVIHSHRATIRSLMDAQAASNAIGNIAHAEQEREKYDRAPHPEWEPKR